MRGEMPKEIWVGLGRTWIKDVRNMGDKIMSKTHTSYIRADQLTTLTAENERLITRLEVADHGIDGIEARDATIKMLEGEIERLKELLAECEDTLGFYADHDIDNEKGLYGYYIPDTDGTITKEKSDFVLDLGEKAQRLLAKLKGGIV